MAEIQDYVSALNGETAFLLFACRSCSSKLDPRKIFQRLQDLTNLVKAGTEAEYAFAEAYYRLDPGVAGIADSIRHVIV